MTELTQSNAPRVGDDLSFKGVRVGTVTRVDGNRAWRSYPDRARPFIWRWHDGKLNGSHTWESPA